MDNKMNELSTSMTSKDYSENVRDLIQVDSIVSIPRSEFLMLRELLETALEPRVKFQESHAEMRKEAQNVMKENVRSALMIIGKIG
jgi:hypothetical protein